MRNTITNPSFSRALSSGGSGGQKLRRQGLPVLTAVVLALPMVGGSAVAEARRILPVAVPAAGVNTNVDGFPVLFNQSGSGGGQKVWVIGHHGYVPPTARRSSAQMR
jgi:hypothetical protein